MYNFPLTGAQKKFLRSCGQRLDATLHLGKDGLSPTFLRELQHQLNRSELVKLRLHGTERDARAALCAQIADEGRCVCLGTVGHTALFFRRQSVAERRVIELP
jgi:RNA-binding protein